MKSLLFVLALTIASLSVLARPSGDTTTLSLQVGAAAKSASLSVVDSTSATVIQGAQVSNFAIQNPHPELVALSAVYTGGIYSIKATPVSKGEGTATITCLVTYTDAGDGLLKSENKTIVIAYTVIYNPPHGAKLSLTFN